MPNTRLKRLLDKKKTALAMPRHRLAEFEDEYAELLDRIEAEKKKLEIDSESIDEIAESFKNHPHIETVLLFLEGQPDFKKEINSLESQMRKAAANGDIESMDFCKARLHKAWRYVTDKALENQQISLL